MDIINSTIRYERSRKGAVRVGKKSRKRKENAKSLFNKMNWAICLSGLSYWEWYCPIWQRKRETHTHTNTLTHTHRCSELHKKSKHFTIFIERNTEQCTKSNLLFGSRFRWEEKRLGFVVFFHCVSIGIYVCFSKQCEKNANRIGHQTIKASDCQVCLWVSYALNGITRNRCYQCNFPLGGCFFFFFIQPKPFPSARSAVFSILVLCRYCDMLCLAASRK